MKKRTIVQLGVVVLVVATVYAASLLLTTEAPAQYKPSAGSANSVNGLDVVVLGGLLQHLEGKPDKGQVTFYSNSRWQEGMRSFTSFTGYEIDGKMHRREGRQFVLLGDEAAELSGSDAAPGAVEELMYAMATCMIAAGNANAALMGVHLDRFEVAIEADVDLHGLLALDMRVRPGLQDIRAHFTIAGDADEATLEKICMLGYQYSPVSETVRNGRSFTPTIKVIN